MKTTMLYGLSLSLALILLTPASALAWEGEPQFTIKTTGSDHAGFDVLASYPKGTPTQCTVRVEVTFSANSRKVGKEEFKYEGLVHPTGNGFAWFGGEAALDKSPLLDVKKTSSSCVQP